jgi:multisubunit Na+/H+ antiporter MnhE subunit
MKGRGKLAVVIAIALPLFYVFWLVFVGTFSAHELEIGIVATMLATAGTVVIDVQYPSRFVPSVGELLSVWRLPWYLLSGTVQILMVALRDLFGTPAPSLFRVVRFHAGARDERAVARRVLAVGYTTMTPTSIVLGINSNDQKLLVHELQRNPVSKMAKQLGARA